MIAGLPFASATVDRTSGFVDAFARAGHAVPADDIVYTGFDAAGGRQGATALLSRRLAAEMTVALTTVRSPMHAMGRESVRMLVSILGGTEVGSERLAPELVPRASSDFTL